MGETTKAPDEWANAKDAGDIWLDGEGVPGAPLNLPPLVTAEAIQWGGGVLTVTASAGYGVAIRCAKVKSDYWVQAAALLNTGENGGSWDSPYPGIASNRFLPSFKLEEIGIDEGQKLVRSKIIPKELTGDPPFDLPYLLYTVGHLGEIIHKSADFRPAVWYIDPGFGYIGAEDDPQSSDTGPHYVYAPMRYNFLLTSGEEYQIVPIGGGGIPKIYTHPLVLEYRHFNGGDTLEQYNQITHHKGSEVTELAPLFDHTEQFPYGFDLYPEVPGGVHTWYQIDPHRGNEDLVYTGESLVTHFTSPKSLFFKRDKGFYTK
jgi:hypothetical protein